MGSVYLGDDYCWHDDSLNMRSEPFIDANDALNERIFYQRLAWRYGQKAKFYSRVEDELSNG